MTNAAPIAAAPQMGSSATPWYRRLYTVVLAAIIAGAVLGYCYPDVGANLKPLGDLFIRLIRMMIEPIVFVTVVVGVGNMGNAREVGRVGLKAFIYFEALTSLALVLGLIAANVIRPGDGITLDSPAVSPAVVAASAAEHPGFLAALLQVVPESVVGAFAKGETLQVLFFSVLLGLGLSSLGTRARPVLDLFERLTQGLFAVIGLIMRLAPIGAFGAMAFTVGKYGLGALHHLGLLLLGMFVTCAVFIFGVLMLVARLGGFSLWRFLVYIREEILVVLGTSTSESALPGLMLKLERLGCARPVVGLVVPTGYAFNLDGTSVYLTMAALFIAQAAHVPFGWEQQLALLGLLLLTSKGSAAVTGGGFVTLAATVSSLHTLPIAGLSLVFGVDRFMSEARALTNLIGNGVATIIVARWEGALDTATMRRVLSGEETP
ncbi:MAG: C4-dicarboxylate transporter DctA [Proteobacteria bacterium]|nr:C4-dicarboxylate transporter DctA [Pseudomonadota bacterium]